MNNGKRTLVIISLVLILVISASMITTGIIAANNRTVDALPVFYRLAPQDGSNLKQIVLADSRIQKLIEGKNYAFEVQGQLIKGEDWDIQVGAILKDGIKAEELDRWLDEGRTGKNVIDRYVGVLYIGYNDVYNLEIDADTARVSDMSARISRFDYKIPELTVEDRKEAVSITLGDSRIKELLAGKGFIITPESVVIWHSTRDHKKIGAGLEICLDKTHMIDYAWIYPEYNEDKYPSFPYYNMQTETQAVEVSSLTVLVDLEKGEIAGIMPYSVKPGMED